MAAAGSQGVTTSVAGAPSELRAQTIQDRTALLVWLKSRFSGNPSLNLDYIWPQENRTLPPDSQVQNGCAAEIYTPFSEVLKSLNAPIRIVASTGEDRTPSVGNQQFRADSELAFRKKIVELHWLCYTGIMSPFPIELIPPELLGQQGDQRTRELYILDLVSVGESIRSVMVNDKLIPMVINMMQDPLWMLAESVRYKFQRLKIWHEILKKDRCSKMVWLLSPFSQHLNLRFYYQEHEVEEETHRTKFRLFIEFKIPRMIDMVYCGLIDHVPYLPAKGFVAATSPNGSFKEYQPETTSAFATINQIAAIAPLVTEVSEWAASGGTVELAQSIRTSPVANPISY